MKERKIITDGNEAAAYVAYKTNEICSIYPITPASPMGEHADLWSSLGKKNIWGQIPRVVEMQSEAGAAGAVHGSLQAGALTTTFTASQGLLLMIPDMFKIAGELNPAVFHIASRTIASHALSIFCDHSDVMAARSTGFAMFFSGSVQEVMDFALIAQAASLKTRIPFLHIFDGFRTSHEVVNINELPDKVIRAMIDQKAIRAHKERALSPDNPVIRGTAQNPDVFFQNREKANLFYQNLIPVLKETMNEFSQLTSRKYNLFEYFGHQNPERVIVVMGSGALTVEETVAEMECRGERVGVIKVNLFRPFSVEDFIRTLPSSVKCIAVLDRTKEPGALGEPLYQDVLSAISECFADDLGQDHQYSSLQYKDRYLDEFPRVTGGRFGLSSKEFTPAMVKGIFDEMKKEIPKNHFTIGIKDDISNTSLKYDPSYVLDKEDTFQGIFFGLGSDGTVSAVKNSIKILGEKTPKNVQGYFVYDSRKSGSLTVSHLRYSEDPVNSPYLVDTADFVACHQFNYLEKYEVLEKARKGATFLLNAPYPPEQVWEHLPEIVQKTILDKKLKFYVINATEVAKNAGLGGRINTVLQTCFFALSGVLPHKEFIGKIKEAIRESYSRKGKELVQKNFNAVDQAVSSLGKVAYPQEIKGIARIRPTVSRESPEFVREVLGPVMAGKGDSLPVSAFPGDGTYPTATTQWEKRGIAAEIPVWDEQLCTQCNKCLLNCPHAAIRAKIYDNSLLTDAPENFKSAAPIGKGFDRENEVYTLQVSAEDCTGCQLCEEVCPVVSKENPEHKAINMNPVLPFLKEEKENWEFFSHLPETDRNRVNHKTVKGSQMLQPLFEFSGACSGCGETPYLKLLTQLFGDHIVIANATGCSSIYGGNLPTTPWAKNHNGQGPAWSNSLFEDNAEFGFGMNLAYSNRKEQARSKLLEMKDQLGEELVNAIIQENNGEENEARVNKQRENVRILLNKLQKIKSKKARELSLMAGSLVDTSVWIVGGDGWAYDIGYGGLDHVLASGENVNVLVMDTEVYSNTGGQKSKATPLAATAKFAMAGKGTPKKDLGMIAVSYGNIYVAQIAMGGKDSQTVKAFNEAYEYPGPSLIIAYSPCIAHGYDLSKGAEQQNKAVKSGYWPLFRYDPRKAPEKRFSLDSKKPSIPLEDYLYAENRYAMLKNQNGNRANDLLELAQMDIRHKWNRIESLLQNGSKSSPKKVKNAG